MTLHLACWPLLGRYTAAATGATEFLGDAIAAYERNRAAPRDAGVFALAFGVLWKLALVVGLIVLTVWLLRRFLGTGGLPLAPSGAIRVLSVHHLDARHAVWLVEVGERLLLVGGGGGALSTLADFQSPVERAAIRESVRTAQGAGTFASTLSSWAARMSGGSPRGQLESGKEFLAERIEKMRRDREST